MSRDSSPTESRFGSCSATTYGLTFRADLDLYVESGVAGMGIWETKLSRGDIGEEVEAFQESGLKATFCFPRVPGMIFSPGLFPEPRDPQARLPHLLAGIRRLARFQPQSVVCLAGDPAVFDPAEARSWSVAGIREAAFVAGEEGVELTLEVIRPRADGGGFARTIPEALDFVADVDMPNVGLMVDTWHVWDQPDIRAQILEFGDAINAVQINDRKPGSLGWWDRALPGEGELDLVSIVGALVDSGYDGWYELEVFSDDGTLGHDLGEASLWRLEPAVLIERARHGFGNVWRQVLDRPTVLDGEG